MRVVQVLPIMLFLLILTQGAIGQFLDVTKIQRNKPDRPLLSNLLAKELSVPVILIGLGIATNKSKFESQLQINLRNIVGNSFEFRIDDYIQFVPILELYTANFIGLKSKNHWFNQTKFLIVSNLITSAITHSFKRIVNKTRPNGSPHSFPSGHTSFAFTNASVLAIEYRQVSPMLALTGFTFAFSTAAFRIFNNKHWFSDIMVGAGLGILVTEIVYHIEPFKDFNPFASVKNIVLMPLLDTHRFGFYFTYGF